MTEPKKPRVRAVSAAESENAARLAELESKYLSALQTIATMSTNNAMLSQHAGLAHRSPIMSGTLVVGLRNVSNYTIGLTDTTTGQEIVHTLHPEVAGFPDPKTRAIVSYAFWQQLRSGKQVGNGLIVRDDTVLGPAENAAPEDRPEDMHPAHAQNVVLNPRQWILDHPEDAMRDKVAAMTSEPTLRRLIEAVDLEVWNLGEQKFKDDPDKARKAIKALSSVFRSAEELFYERLDELNPVSRARDQEASTVRQLARS